jgi:hypothetical protein
MSDTTKYNTDSFGSFMRTVVSDISQETLDGYVQNKTKMPAGTENSFIVSMTNDDYTYRLYLCGPDGLLRKLVIK